MSDKDNEKELSANPEDLGLREPGAGDDGAGVREGTVAESAAPDDGGAEASAAGEAETVAEASEMGRPAKFGRLTGDGADRRKLTGMYKDWFLDYASYVILERAVPHVDDGLKPVQRRILHAMRKLDDGRYNKVANIIGSTMQYHPHGDASIGDALVQLGQKDMLIDCQGNWGNILTGDGAAAPRYIEARLSKFALDVVFNPKTTEWMLSYDGRNQEPVTLPVKFPLLLAQGVEGIAVGLASKILPHNFNELVDASIAYLRGEPFELYPDFPSGGLCDVTRYNDGLRGGAVKVRARINKIDKRTLAITEIPYGTTTESIKESIIKANDKGKIKIKKVDDNTSDQVEIIIHVSNDESSDRTIDALYAFTDCEVSISPNSCVIMDDKPHFMGVHEILRRCADRTRELLRRELEIRLEELEQDWHMSSLEKIFIENKIYQRMEEATSREAAYAAVDEGLKPFAHLLRREITLDDVVKLTELRMIRISRYDSFKADEHVKSVEQEIAQVKRHLATLTDFTIAYFRRIKEKYGRGRERRTELREFDSIEATKVVVANAKLYVDRAEGFFGIGSAMRKDEFVCDCSDIDDVIVVTKEGKYVITKVSEKAFFAKNIYYIGIFKRNDERTIYNVLYRDGRGGPLMMKRCAIKGITRDREYDLTKGTPRSEILYMSVNPNGGRGAESLLQAETEAQEADRRPEFRRAGHQGPAVAGQSVHALCDSQDRAQGARRVDARRHQRVVRRRDPAAQHGRPGRVAGRVLGRRQADRDDGQGPLLYDGLRSGRSLPGGDDPRREVRSGPHILGRLLRRRAELLLRQALYGRAERPDAEFRRRGGRSVARGDQRRPLSPAAGRLCGT